MQPVAEIPSLSGGGKRCLTGTLFALMGTENAMDLDDARRQIAQLRQGMETRGRVGIAIGIVMTRFEIDEQSAFDYLVRRSQHANVKLVHVAESVISEQPKPERLLRSVPADS